MNFDSKSLAPELRPAFFGFQQPPRFFVLRYFLFFFSGFFGAAGLAGLCSAAGGCAAGFGAVAEAFAAAFTPFLSLLLLSFGFGCSLIPESFRKIFSRSSGVFPFPVNCIAKS